jgi:3-deoxy-D-manno-octulosonic-acid transferase
MIAFYNLILKFLKPFLGLGINFSTKGQKFINQRKKTQFIAPNAFHLKKVIWLHGASVGELDQCKAIAKVIKEEIPESFILQSVFSSSVSERNLISNYIDFSFYLPLDFQNNYDIIFKTFSPQILIIAAWDVWPNLVSTAKKNFCKVYLSCGTIHSGSGRLKNKFMRNLTSATLNMLDGISPANHSREILFKKLTTNVEIYTCGDSRFDSVSEKIESKESNNNIFENLEFQKVLILASTYSECEDIIFPVLDKIISENYTIWIFPHKIDSVRINNIINKLKEYKYNYQIYSEIQNKSNSKIIVFDKYGILAYAYEKARICYVGGGFHNRIHNTIEPAYFGLPICTGPKIFHAPEAIDLNQLDLLKVIDTSDDFLKFVIENFEKNTYSIKSEKIKKYVEDNRGASKRFFEHFIKKVIQ